MPENLIVATDSGGGNAAYPYCQNSASNTWLSLTGGAIGQVVASNAPGFAAGDYVQSNFGWHIIRVEDTRKLDAPEFDKIAPQIKQRLQSQKLEEHITALRQAAKVE